MYEYKFVVVEAKWTRSKPDPEVLREAIRIHAAEGWRLVQVLILNPAANPTEYEVIFERVKQ